MLHGTCLCGAVDYSIDHDPTDMGHCHCSMCRKAHGTAFATYTGAPAAAVTWNRGKDHVVRFESSPGFVRAFCPTCGSVIYAASAGSETLHFPAGSLDDDFAMRPDHHIFVASKAVWYDITDHLPQHDAYDSSSPVVERDDRASPQAGTVGGSCLCGAVAFRYSGPPVRMWNCHCSRCRHARSAAHATNVFVPRESFHWVRGEELVETYRLPEAERFGQAFCRRCGGAVARAYAESPTVNIPAGSLDDDPGMRATGNIYVGSKASWYPITDDLPQYEEGPPG